MNEEFMIISPSGESKYLIERVFHIRNGHFFSIINMGTYEIMFGQYLGELPGEDDDQCRRIILQNFKEGCTKIVYPDDYIVEELFDLWGDI